jgi:acyl carrier protein
MNMPSSPSPVNITDRLAEILRRDLKLGDSAVIRPDTKLIGGDHDLDSLDVLMLITSVEKTFGIKIPNEEIRRDAFTTVASLAAYIEERLTAQDKL